MSHITDVPMPVLHGTDHSLLSVDDFRENSGTSPGSLAETFSDPDPTTMVVSGSEKDASGGSEEKRFRRLTAVSGGKEEEGNGNGNKFGEEDGRLEFDAAKEYEFRIISFCFEHGFVTRKIIDRFLLSDFQYRSRSRLLDRLIMNGFLYRREGNWAERRGVYQLTRNGECRARVRSPYRYTASFRPRGEQIDHDEAIMEIRILLVRLLGGRWQPERSLRTARQAEIPDGLLHLGSDARIVVEVEYSKKGPRRLEKLLARWSSNEISLVLYVCKNDWMAEFIQEQMRTFSGAEHLGIITLENLRMGRTKIWTPAGERKLLKTSELA